MHGDCDSLGCRFTNRIRLVAIRYNIVYIISSARCGNAARDGGIEIISAIVGQSVSKGQRRRQCAVHAGERDILDIAAGADFLRKRGHRQLHGRVHLDGTGNRNRIAHRVSLVGGSLDGVLERARLGRGTGNGLRRSVEGHTRRQHACRLADGSILDIENNRCQ